MSDKEYLRKLGEKRGSRLNQIIAAVQNRIPKDNAGLKDAVEEKFFDSLEKQAADHVKKYGFFPVFDLYEIETDDPVLDIYKN